MSRETATTDFGVIATWLGLPPGPWPPDHYALLGLTPGESGAPPLWQGPTAPPPVRLPSDATPVPAKLAAALEPPPVRAPAAIPVGQLVTATGLATRMPAPKPADPLLDALGNSSKIQLGLET